MYVIIRFVDSKWRLSKDKCIYTNREQAVECAKEYGDNYSVAILSSMFIGGLDLSNPTYPLPTINP